MKRALLSAVLVALSIGCGPKFSEKDLTGTWQVDNASVPKTGKASAMASSSLVLREDHTFEIPVSSMGVTIKGSWSYAELKLSFKAASLSVKTPAMAQTRELTIDQVLRFAQASGTPNSDLEEVRQFRDGINLRVSEDGKTLTSEDNLVWRKG